MTRSRATKPPTATAGASGVQPVLPAALATGIRVPKRRTTWETARGPQQTPSRLAPNDLEARWRTLRLESETLTKIGAYELLSLLVDLSPEASKALWDFLRFCNPSHTLTVTDLAGNPFPEGEFVVQTFQQTLTDLYGSPDVVYNRLFAQAWLRGGFFVELVLAGDYTGADLATPDPLTVLFQSETDPVRGEVYRLGQQQRGTFVSLEAIPTVRYAPIDPLPGVPYGRPIGAPGLFACTFLLAVLRDWRMVIQQQGYEHVDLTVVQEILKQQVPLDIQDDPTKIQAYVDQALADVAAVYTAMEPDDAYVHTDAITVNKSAGAANADAIGGIAGTVEFLERMALRAFKSMPLLMGITDGVSEANANRQWEIHLAGTEAIQNLASTVLSSLYQLLLFAAGLQGFVAVRFGQVRGSEALRDEQVRAERVKNALREYLFGYITHQEASVSAVGRLPALPEPLLIPKEYGDTSGGEEAPNGNPDQSAKGGEDKKGGTQKMAPSVVAILREASARLVAEAEAVED